MKEEVKKAVGELKQRYINLELVGVSGDGVIKLKLSMPEAAASQKFKVAGKVKTYEELMRKEVEKDLRTRVKTVKKVVFVK